MIKRKNRIYLHVKGHNTRIERINQNKFEQIFNAIKPVLPTLGGTLRRDIEGEEGQPQGIALRYGIDPMLASCKPPPEINAV